MKKFFIFILITFSISSCSGNSRVLDVKSPCVSAKDGPCGPRRPVNDWLLKDHKYQS